MQTVLLLIAFQNSNFKKKGSQSIKAAKKAAKAAAKLLEYFREHSMPIVHVLQTGKLEALTAEKLKPYELLEPKQNELTLITSEISAFADGKLKAMLSDLHAGHLLIAGLTAEKQILATVQAAREQAYSCTVVEDACPARSLKWDGEKISAALVQSVMMAIMKEKDVQIATAKTFIKSEQKRTNKLAREAANQEATLEAAKAALLAAELRPDLAKGSSAPKDKKGSRKARKLTAAEQPSKLSKAKVSGNRADSANTATSS